MIKAKFSIRKAKFHIKSRKINGVNIYWFRIVSGNGKKLAHSEMYTRKASAIKAINAIVFPLCPVIVDTTKTK